MKNHIFRALSERSFLYLWVGEIFTQIAANLFNFFLILIVFETTHSNTAVSGIVISFTIPAIIFGMLAGAYVDRWNKKYVLISSNLLRVILLVILAFTLKNVVSIYIISFICAVIAQFFIPAETPMLPLVVKSENLYSANALFGMAVYGSILVAYMISGPLLIFLRPQGTTLFLAAFMALGAILISFVKLERTKSRQQELSVEDSNIFDELKHTVKLISKTRAVSHSLFLLALSQILILVVATIAPGYATSVLKLHLETFLLLFVTPAAIGIVVGAVVLITYFHSHPKNKLITAGIFLSGFSMLALPFGNRVVSKDFIHIINAYLPHFFQIDILHIITLLAFILGFADALVFVPANTILQETTSDEFRGKIYGFLNTLVGILSFIPIIAVGGLSDLIGVANVIIWIGVALLFLGIVRLFIEY